MTRSDWISLLGVCCLALFGYAVFPASSLLVMGVAAIAHSYIRPSETEGGS